MVNHPLIKKKFVRRKTIIDKIGDVVLYLKEYIHVKTAINTVKSNLKTFYEKYKKASTSF